MNDADNTAICDEIVTADDAVSGVEDVGEPEEVSDDAEPDRHTDGDVALTRAIIAFAPLCEEVCRDLCVSLWNERQMSGGFVKHTVLCSSKDIFLRSRERIRDIRAITDERLWLNKKPRTILWAYTDRELELSMYLGNVLLYVNFTMHPELLWDFFGDHVMIEDVVPSIGACNVLGSLEAMDIEFRKDTSLYNCMPNARVLFVPCDRAPHERKAAILAALSKRLVNQNYVGLQPVTVFLFNGTVEEFFNSVKWKVEDLRLSGIYEDYDIIPTEPKDFWSADAMKECLNSYRESTKTKAEAKQKPLEAEAKVSQKAVETKAVETKAEAKAKVSQKAVETKAEAKVSPICSIPLRAGNRTLTADVFSNYAEIDGERAVTHFEWFMKHKDKFSSAQDVTDAITKAVRSDSWPKGHLGYVIVKSADIEKIPDGAYMKRYKSACLSTIETLEAITVTR